MSKKNASTSRPLESRTIGTYKRGKNSVWILLFLFITFGTVVYFLPQISNYYRKYIGIYFGQGPVNDDETNNIENTSKNYKVGDNKFSAYDIEFYDSKLVNGKFYINAKASKDINLTSLKYYLAIYDKSDKLIKWFLINGQIKKDEVKEISFDIEDNFDTFNILSAGENSYPDSKITGVKGNKFLVCQKGDEKITYNFVDDGLDTLKYDVLVKMGSLNFDDLKLKYYNMYFEYNSNVPGFTSKYNIDTDIILNIEIDYKQVVSDLKEDIFFKKGVNSAEINYKMLVNGYTCS